MKLFFIVTQIFLSSLLMASETSIFSPQFEVAGTGIAVLNGINGNQSPAESNIDLGDSYILFGGSEALYYGKGIGQFIMGFLIIEEEELSQSVSGKVGSDNEIKLFPFQTLVNYESKNFQIKLGRTDIPITQLIQFPVLREADFLTIYNPFSNGKIVEESFFSNLASFTLNQKNIFYESLYLQHLIDSNDTKNNPWINSMGVNLEYIAPPGREKLDSLLRASLGYEALFFEKGQNILTGGLQVRLNQSFTNRIDFRLMDVLAFGSDVTSFENINDIFSANYNFLAMAINFIHEPFGLPIFQISLTGSWRPYLEIENAYEYEGILTGAKRIGEGFDLVSQITLINRGPSLAEVYGGQSTEWKLELGLVFNFETIFNQHLTPTRRILNYGYQYIPN
jgi:hypothetical protein